MRRRTQINDVLTPPGNIITALNAMNTTYPQLQFKFYLPTVTYFHMTVNE